MNEDTKKTLRSLMRVNHSGEICAQALYQAQSIMARSSELKQLFRQSATEEAVHLTWCENELKSLNGRTSKLNALWYLGSFSIGLAAGLLGDKFSLGFLAETEHQVVQHLNGHLAQIPPNATSTRQTIENMIKDEQSHANAAIANGALDMPRPIKFIMRCTAKIMTSIAHHI